ncbi:hypothetical protein I305_04445 [Cryptococcus gattii E566]|uniref:Uncharacterized protein n=1 Tax=Cryptococcus gattii EJB2 TaxID=1296103 RepID=A0ABR5BSJ8_9TREE|nr:hypothetical protein I306_04632 [Cryptococcus gattii EJB2]KIY33117.1 hypothetical protein I305_04445 [Cryptococcus gattii E566]KJE02870.1 hypothetical protein I311_03372 [Cryptococcus gattii NT-10]
MITVPTPTLLLCQSMPLLKPPPMVREGGNEKQGRLGKLRKMGSDLLMKTGMKKVENWDEWEVVDAPKGNMSSRQRCSVQIVRGPKNEKRSSRIPWPPSPPFEHKTGGDGSNSTSNGSRRPSSFPSFTSFLEIPAGTVFERSSSDTNSGSGEGSWNGAPSDPHQLSSALSAVLYLRSVLYAHAASAQSLLESHAEVLPGFVYHGLSRQIDQWWAKGRSALNSMGAQTASALLRVSSSPPPPPSPLLLPLDPIDSPISPPLTHDSLQKLIWSLEEAGQVPSFTFVRMFGKSAQVELRKLENEEAWEATRKGWREYQDDEWGCLQREIWRDSADIHVFGFRGRKGKKCFL